MSGLAATLIALNSLLALAMGVQSFRLVRREPGLVLSLISQVVLAMGFSGWFWLLLAAFESLFTDQLASATVALCMIESACLLAIEVQLLLAWRARFPWTLGLAMAALFVGGLSLSVSRHYTTFPTPFWISQALLAIVELTALPLMLAALNIGRAR